jgi:hypothetical protein
MSTEAEMRKWHIPLALLLCGGVWLATTGTAAHAQDHLATANMTQGERVSVWIEGARSSVQCEVISITNEFLGCAADKRTGDVPPGFTKAQTVESWYNLRFVTRIDRPVKD